MFATCGNLNFQVVYKKTYGPKSFIKNVKSIFSEKTERVTIDIQLIRFVEEIGIGSVFNPAFTRRQIKKSANRVTESPPIS